MDATREFRARALAHAQVLSPARARDALRAALDCGASAPSPSHVITHQHHKQSQSQQQQQSDAPWNIVLAAAAIADHQHLLVQHQHQLQQQHQHVPRDSNSQQQQYEQHGGTGRLLDFDGDIPLSDACRLLDLLLRTQFQLLSIGTSHAQVPGKLRRPTTQPHSAAYIALFFRGYYPGARAPRRLLANQLSDSGLSTSSSSSSSSAIGNASNRTGLYPQESTSLHVGMAPSPTATAPVTPLSATTVVTATTPIATSCCYKGPIFTLSPGRVLDFLQETYDIASSSSTTTTAPNSQQNKVNMDNSSTTGALAFPGFPMIDIAQFRINANSTGRNNNGVDTINMTMLSPWTEFIKEAYTIYLQLSDIQYYLTVARRAYLDLDRGRQFRYASLLRGGYSVEELPRCSPLRLLPNPLVMEDIHRNQMDLQIQVFLKAVSSRIVILDGAVEAMVIALEASDKERIKRLSKLAKTRKYSVDGATRRKSSEHGGRVQNFFRRYIDMSSENTTFDPETYVIPGPHNAHTYRSDHFKSIVWYLQKHLMTTLEIQSQLQQYRFDKINQRQMHFMKAGQGESSILTENNSGRNSKVSKSSLMHADSRDELPGISVKGARSMFGLKTVQKRMSELPDDSSSTLLDTEISPGKQRQSQTMIINRFNADSPSKSASIGNRNRLFSSGNTTGGKGLNDDIINDKDFGGEDDIGKSITSKKKKDDNNMDDEDYDEERGKWEALTGINGQESQHGRLGGMESSLTSVRNRRDGFGSTTNGMRTSGRFGSMDGFEELINEDIDTEINQGGLSQQMLLELETENESLLEEMESTMDQVRKVTQSLQEISNLQSQLAHHLDAQREVIDGIYDDSWQNTETVQMANIQLIKAQKNFANAHFRVFIFLLCASVGLLLFDYFH